MPLDARMNIDPTDGTITLALLTPRARIAYFDLVPLWMGNPEKSPEFPQGATEGGKPVVVTRRTSDSEVSLRRIMWTISYLLGNLARVEFREHRKTFEVEAQEAALIAMTGKELSFFLEEFDKLITKITEERA